MMLAEGPLADLPLAEIDDGSAWPPGTVMDVEFDTEPTYATVFGSEPTYDALLTTEPET